MNDKVNGSFSIGSENKEEYKTDKYGNHIIPMDIDDNNLKLLFEGYLVKNNYSLVSRQHFECLLEEDTEIYDAISSTVVNEIVYQALDNFIEEEKRKENESNS